MQLQIDGTTIQLLEPAPNWSKLPDPQAETYRLLLAIASIRTGEPKRITMQVVTALHGVNSPLPIRSRLRNLADKGYITLSSEQIPA